MRPKGRLREFHGEVERIGDIGTCSFCGKEAKVIDFANFIEHVKDVVYRYFGTIDEENLPLDFFHEDNFGFGFAREVATKTGRLNLLEPIHSLSTYDLLNLLGLVTENLTLNEAIEECFDTSQEWIRHNPLSFTDGEWVSFFWKSFCDTIKSKRRFTIDEYEFEGDYYGDTLSYKDVINRIFSAIKDAQMCITLLFWPAWNRSSILQTSAPLLFGIPYPLYNVLIIPVFIRFASADSTSPIPLFLKNIAGSVYIGYYEIGNNLFWEAAMDFGPISICRWAIIHFGVAGYPDALHPDTETENK